MDPFRLVGTWDFRRVVDDHRDGAEYVAHGQAVFTRDDEGRIRWAEHGILSRDSGSTPVSRTLFLVREPPEADTTTGPDAVAVGEGPGRWRVTFEDGRDFHSWTGGAVEHLCGRDLYRGGVDVPPEPARSWELRWRVTGPDKDYTMQTRYSRAPGELPEPRARARTTGQPGHL